MKRRHFLQGLFATTGAAVLPSAAFAQGKPVSAEQIKIALQQASQPMTKIEKLVVPDAEWKKRLTPSQYNVLRILRGAGEKGHPCQEVGARMISRVPDVTRLLDRLEKAGLVARRRCTEDRRVVHATILPKGLEVLAALDGPVQDLAPRLFHSLSQRELQQLNDLLVRARGS